MADLKATFDALGHHDVRTYIQSGNVVFRTSAGSPTQVRSAIERAIARDSGLEVTVLLRTPGDLTSIIGRNPFGAAVRNPSGADFYVTFLDAKPAVRLIEAIDPHAYTPDTFVVDGREVFVNCPNGYGRTKINNAFFERTLATPATTRNWRTVTLLHDWATA